MATDALGLVDHVCRICRARLFRAPNSWVYFTKSYVALEPDAQIVEPSPGLVEDRKIHDGTSELGGCGLRQLSCENCGMRIGVKCVEAPLEKHQHRDKGFFKSSKLASKDPASGSLVGLNIHGTRPVSTADTLSAKDTTIKADPAPIMAEVSENKPTPPTAVDHNLISLIESHGAAIARIEAMVADLQRDMAGIREAITNPQNGFVSKLLLDEPKNPLNEEREVSASQSSSKRSKRKLPGSRDLATDLRGSSFRICSTPGESLRSRQTTTESSTDGSRTRRETSPKRLCRVDSDRPFDAHSAKSSHTVQQGSIAASKDSLIRSTNSSHTLLGRSLPVADLDGKLPDTNTSASRHSMGRLVEAHSHRVVGTEEPSDQEVNPEQTKSRVSTLGITTMDLVRSLGRTSSPDVVVNEEAVDEDLVDTQEYLKRTVVDDPTDMDYQSSHNSPSQRDEPASMEVAASVDRLLTPAHPIEAMHTLAENDEVLSDMDYEATNAVPSQLDEPASAEVTSSADRLLTPVQPPTKPRSPGGNKGRSGARSGGSGRRRKHLSLGRIPTPEWEKEDWDPESYNVQNKAGPSTNPNRRLTTLRRGVSGHASKSFPPITYQPDSPRKVYSDGKKRDKNGVLMTANGQLDGRSLRRKATEGAKQEPGGLEGTEELANVAHLQSQSHEKTMAKVFPWKYKKEKVTK